jgi:hypothetical protein
MHAQAHSPDGGIKVQSLGLVLEVLPALNAILHGLFIFVLRPLFIGYGYRLGIALVQVERSV